MNTNTLNTNDIKGLIIKLLGSITTDFEKDELAFVSFQGKNELQIRDKIAWRLHKKLQEKGLPKEYVVRKEWAPVEKNKDRFDLAILKLDSNCNHVEKAIAIFEFKAQSLARKENWYVDEYLHDLQKMKKFSDESTCKEADFYFIFLMSGQDRSIKNNEYAICSGSQKFETRSTTAYVNSGNLNYNQLVKDEFKKLTETSIANNKFVLKGADKFEKEVISRQSLGKCYGYEVFTTPLVIGPFKASTYTIDEKKE